MEDDDGEWLFITSELRMKVLGTAKRVTEDRSARSAATVVVERRLVNSESSGYEDRRCVMLMAKMGM